jgi:hypothetical protein
MRENGHLWYLDQSGEIWEISQTLADETNTMKEEYLLVYTKMYSEPKA